MSPWLRRLFGHKQGSKKDAPPSQPASSRGQGGTDLLHELRHEFQGSDDIKFHPFRLGESGVEGAVIYAEGLADSSRVEEATLRPLIRWSQEAGSSDIH